MMTDAEFLAVIDRAIKDYVGSVDEIESAVGALAVGRHIGWKPLFIIHQRVTIKKYEKILGVNFREALPEEGPLAKKSVAWKLAQGFSNFWKMVRGEIPGIKTPALE